MRRSNIEPTITTFSSAASFVKLSVVGPGMVSARSNRAEVFGLAEILRAEEFLDANDLRAFGGGLADSPFGLGEILVGVERAGHLNEADAELGLLHKTIVAALGIIDELSARLE